MNAPAHCAAAALLALALTVLPPQARAQEPLRGAVATANLAYTVADLAPSDGIAAAAVFGTPPKVWLDTSMTVQQDGRPQQRWADFQVVAGPAATRNDLSYAHVGTGDFGTGLAAAAALAPPADVAVATLQRTTARQDFRLAPHATITVSLDAAIDLAVATASPAIQNASAQASLEVGPAGTFPWGASIYASVSNDPLYVAYGFQPAASLFETLVQSWTNDSDAWADGSLQFDAYVIADARNGAPVPAVPEPAGWTMLAAGLLLPGLATAARQRRRLGRAALGLLALAAVALPARAQVHAAAATAHLGYVLTDLAPGDGVDPAAVFDAAQASLSRSLSIGPRGGPIQIWTDHEATSAPWALDLDRDRVHGGTGYFGTGSAAAVSIAPPRGGSVASDQSTDVVQRFRLAPHTAIVFSLDAGVDLFTDAASPLMLDAAGATTLLVGAVGAAPPGSMLFDTASNWVGPAPTDQRTVTMVERWQNDSGAWADGELSFRSWVFAEASDPALVPWVPEPRTWAMLVAGLGLLGWRARRTRT